MAKKRWSKEEVLALLEQHIPELKKFTVTKIGLFGSVVRGENKKKSDIDLLVELGDETFDNYYDTKVYLEKKFGCNVDLVIIDSIKLRIRDRILGEAAYVTGF